MIYYTYHILKWATYLCLRWRLWLDISSDEYVVKVYSLSPLPTPIDLHNDLSTSTDLTPLPLPIISTTPPSSLTDCNSKGADVSPSYTPLEWDWVSSVCILHNYFLAAEGPVLKQRVPDPEESTSCCRTFKRLTTNIFLLFLLLKI